MDPMAAIMPMVQQAVQQAMSANGGGQPQGANGLKPKIDINNIGRRPYASLKFPTTGEKRNCINAYTINNKA
jgi:hypothetical protein